MKAKTPAGEVVIDFTVIRPKQFDLEDMRLKLLSEMSKFSNEVISEYNKTVRYWDKNKPVFTKSLKTNVKNKKFVSTEVYTENKLYSYIDYGTGPTEIVPNVETESGKIGTWRGYKAGSKPGPGVLDTLATSPSQVGKIKTTGKLPDGKGSYLPLNIGLKRDSIHHPGVAARGFTDAISDKFEEKMRDRFQSVLDGAEYWK